MGAKGEPQQQGAAVATRARAYVDRRRGGSVVDGEGGRAVTTRKRGQHRGNNRSGTCVRRPARGVSAANGARDIVLGPALALGGADAGPCFGAGTARRVRVPAGIAAETNAPGGAKRRRSGPTPEDVGRCRCYCYYCCGCACRGAGVLKCCGRRQRSLERSGEEKKTCVGVRSERARRMSGMREGVVAQERWRQLGLTLARGRKRGATATASAWPPGLE